MGKGLQDFIKEIDKNHDQEYNSIHLPNNYYFPGYLTALCAFMRKRGVKYDDFDYHVDSASYFGTAAIENSVWGEIAYNRQRRNEGQTYSKMTPLESIESVDLATDTINSCIRKLAGRNVHSEGVTELCFVVGELHDNVWSHGNSTGFSMAQRSKVPRENDYYIEFALADCGIGFLGEMARAGLARDLHIDTHSEAINWCIREGHSTKHVDMMDTWSQKAPWDHLGANPFGDNVNTTFGDNYNNHQGLGLAHLINLVRDYNGELIIVSGDCSLISNCGESVFVDNDTNWDGVAISCKFKESELTKDKNTLNNQFDDESDILELMTQLRG